MTDVLEISSDSSDTIILSTEEDLFIQSKVNANDTNVKAVVDKFISENCLQTDAEFNSKEQDCIDENLDLGVPVTKRLKKANEELNSNPSSESANVHNEVTEVDTLVMLSEKYKQVAVVNNAYENDDILTEKNIRSADKKNLEKQIKEAQKQKKIEEREQKKKEAEQEKVIKQLLAAANKNSKPTECLKFITVQIDRDIAKEDYGSEVITTLTKSDVQYTIKPQIFPRTVTWIRKVQSHSMNDNGKLVLTSEDQEADEVLLILNCKELIEHINNKTLSGYIQSIKSVLINKKITLAIYGLQSYYRFLKNRKNNETRAQITDGNKRATTHQRFFKDFPNVSRKMIEYGLTELQLMCSCSHRLIDSAADVGLIVAQFTKAVAEIPFKLQRYEKFQQTDWFVAGDNRDCVKVDKSGNGLNRLWNQMLTTFPLARLETAEAISLKYPTVSSLMKAYENCVSTKEAELLLAEIFVRRAAGPLSSSRKIGPELSKKIYNFFTSTDGDSLL